MDTVLEHPRETNSQGMARQKRVSRDIQRRLVNHLANGRTTDMAPGMLPIKASVFTDPERLAAEKRELFLKVPLVAGLSCDIPGPGDMLVFDAAGPSILVVRGEDRRLRAFLNMCRHRMAPVVRECSTRRRLTCPFHGWTYDLKGNLVAIPGAEGFAGLDKNNLGLTPVPVAEWNGFIFVKAHPGDEIIDVEKWLGTMAPEMKQLDLATSQPVTKTRAEVSSNWKFAQDTFFEGYHFATIHPTTIGSLAITNVCAHDAFGPHQRVMMPGREYLDLVGKPESEWPEIPYQGIHLIFPNTIFFVGHLETFPSEGQKHNRQIYGMWRIFPGEKPGEAFTLMNTYRPSNTGENEISEYQSVSEFMIKVIKEEDYSLCRDGQKNLEANPHNKITLGRNEVALQSIERHIAEAIGMPID